MTPHQFSCTTNAASPEPTYALPYPGYSGNQLNSLCPFQTQVFCRVLQFADNGFFVVFLVVYWVIFAHCVSGGDVRMLTYSMTGGLHPQVSNTCQRKGKERGKKERVCLCTYSMKSVHSVLSFIFCSCLSRRSIQTVIWVFASTYNSSNAVHLS